MLSGKRLLSSIFVLFLVFVLSAQAFGATIRVNPSSAYDGPGSDWYNGYRSITKALNAAVTGDEIWVREGVYQETLQIKAGVSLYGGFSGVEGCLDLRDYEENVTIIQSTAIVASTATGGVRIDGFTIRNGTAFINGGALAVMTSGPVTVVNNIISGCRAASYGGAIYAGNANLTIRNNRIAGCSAPNGGAIYLGSSNAAVHNNAITGCSASVNGGAIYLSGGNATIHNNVITGCATTGNNSNGGAIYFGGTPICSFTNNTIVGNFSAKGGSIYVTSPVTMSNNIVAFNSSGICNANLVTLTLTKNCIYNPDGHNYLKGFSPETTIPGIGNILSNPQLVYPGLGEVHLSTGSPCIDAGEDTAVQTDWLDMDGQERMQGTNVDIGADEYDGTTPTFTPTVIRVRPTGSDGQDGATWATAKKTVQAAITAASVSGGEVWVAAGTYQERITLANGVFVFGGFAGTESYKSDRDPAANPSIIDGLASGSVVTAQNLGLRTSCIDGFTIRNGKASYGAGIFCSHAGPIIANNTISGNTGTAGGAGISCGYSSPLIYGNIVTDNSAPKGAGVYCSLSSSPAILDNTLSGNTATSGGSAIHADADTLPRIAGNSILSNSSPAVHTYYAGSSAMTGNRISGNKGDYPAVHCLGASGASISGNTVEDNEGGGIRCDGGTITVSDNTVRGNAGIGIDSYGSVATVSRNKVTGNLGYAMCFVNGTATVLNNSITANAGGIDCRATSATIANNVISANRNMTIMTSGSAGILCGGSPLICNNTITGCETYMGASICCGYGSSPTIANNIIAFNSSGIESIAATPILRNNCVYNPGATDYQGVAPGATDIQVDPELVAVEYGQVHLQTGSPCIDAGSDSDLLTGWTDIDGQERVLGAHADIGADEYVSAPAAFTPIVVRVSSLGDDANDGSTWAAAKRTLQAGAHAASAQGGEVWAAAGIYDEHLLLPPYAFLYGGFAGDEATRLQRDFVRNETIIDGSTGTGPVVNSFTGNKITASGIDGFTITNGSVDSWNGSLGGVDAHLSSPTIRNNKIIGNVGSGVFCFASQSLIENNLISGNSAASYSGFAASGGGICAFNANPVIRNNRIESNTAEYGGGIGCRGSFAAVISGNVIARNTSTTSGGGVCLPSSYNEMVLNNNTIIENSASVDGGAIYGIGKTIANNILAHNSSGMHGPSYMLLRNNCVYNPAGYNYSGVSAGTGDFSLDPLFVNRVGGDYHLRAGSPCVNAGWGEAAGIPELDFDGESRLNGVIDVGADEYWLGPARTVADAKAAGAGSAVDIYGGIVTAAFADSFYVEADDRSSGMLVRKPGHALLAGNRARVVGSWAAENDPERFVEATTAQATGTGSVAPLAMANGSVGGGTQGLQGGVWGWTYILDDFGRPVRVWDQVKGLNNIGLLITTCGRVTCIEEVEEPSQPTWFTIDDGSGINLKCILPQGVTLDPSWQQVRVTGISSCDRVGEELRAVVKVRRQGDIVGL